MSDNSVRRNHSGAVGIGCGSLVVIALIVFFLGRADLKPLESKVGALTDEVRLLRQQIGATPISVPAEADPQAHAD